MATRKTTAKKTAPASNAGSTYEKLVERYAEAVELLRKESFEEAKAIFEEILGQSADEPELADRARTWIRTCERKLAPAPGKPETLEEQYLLGVQAANDGRLDDALTLFDAALRSAPGDAATLYARASVRAMQGNSESAVADLRQAIAIEPKLRFQAGNDPDFENIRDDAAFIDFIEPTAAGA